MLQLLLFCWRPTAQQGPYAAAAAFAAFVVVGAAAADTKDGAAASSESAGLQSLPSMRPCGESLAVGLLLLLLLLGFLMWVED